MVKKDKNEYCCIPTGKTSGCCKVESVISVDDRGQMVLPKEVRKKAGINPGDKLVIVSLEKDNAICCISLIKVGKFAEMVKDFLGPIMQEMLKK